MGGAYPSFHRHRTLDELAFNYAGKAHIAMLQEVSAPTACQRNLSNYETTACLPLGIVPLANARVFLLPFIVVDCVCLLAHPIILQPRKV